MHDVAREARVHQTTVSLALRNHPRLPLATRQRIQKVAARLGYRPDPMLAAFNFHRLASHPVKGTPAIAFILDADARRCFSQRAGHPVVIEGARQAAKERGYGLEPFVLDSEEIGPRRLDQILLARGIAGVVVSTFETKTTRLELDWPRCCAVKIESRHLWPPLDVITNDQHQVTRLGLRRMLDLGYRRVGLVSTREAERRLGDAFRTGFLVEQASLPESARVPPLLLDDSDRKHPERLLSQWLEKQRIDAVVSNLNDVARFIEATGRRIPMDLAFASLDLTPETPNLAGVVQNHALVGRRAVEQVIALLHAHERGLPEVPSVTFVPGFWRDGSSAPPAEAFE